MTNTCLYINNHKNKIWNSKTRCLDRACMCCETIADYSECGTTLDL